MEVISLFVGIVGLIVGIIALPPILQMYFGAARIKFEPSKMTSGGYVALARAAYHSIATREFLRDLFENLTELFQSSSAVTYSSAMSRSGAITVPLR